MFWVTERTNFPLKRRSRRRTETLFVALVKTIFPKIYMLFVMYEYHL